MGFLDSLPTDHSFGKTGIWIGDIGCPKIEPRSRRVVASHERARLTPSRPYRWLTRVEGMGNNQETDIVPTGPETSDLL